MNTPVSRLTLTCYPFFSGPYRVYLVPSHVNLVIKHRSDVGLLKVNSWSKGVNSLVPCTAGQGTVVLRVLDSTSMTMAMAMVVILSGLDRSLSSSRSRCKRSWAEWCA
jgi:hypothetical protein